MSCFNRLVRIAFAGVLWMALLGAPGAQATVNPNWKLALFVAGYDEDDPDWFRDSQFQIATTFASRGWDVRIIIDSRVYEKRGWLKRAEDILATQPTLRGTSSGVQLPIVADEPHEELLNLFKRLNQFTTVPSSVFVNFNGHGSEPDKDSRGRILGHDVLTLGIEEFSDLEQQFAPLRKSGSKILVFDETCHSGASVFLPIAKSSCVVGVQSHRWTSKRWQDKAVRRDLLKDGFKNFKNGIDFFNYVLEVMAQGVLERFDWLADDEKARAYFPQLTGFQNQEAKMFELLMLRPSDLPKSPPYRREVVDAMESAIRRLEAWGRAHSPNLTRTSRISESDSFFRRVIAYYRLRNEWETRVSALQKKMDPVRFRLKLTEEILGIHDVWLGKVSLLYHITGCRVQVLKNMEYELYDCDVRETLDSMRTLILSEQLFSQAIKSSISDLAKHIGRIKGIGNPLFKGSPDERLWAALNGPGGEKQFIRFLYASWKPQVEAARVEVWKNAREELLALASLQREIDKIHGVLTAKYEASDQSTLWLLHRYQQARVVIEAKKAQSVPGSNPALTRCLEFQF